VHPQMLEGCQKTRKVYRSKSDHIRFVHSRGHLRLCLGDYGFNRSRDFRIIIELG